MGTNYYFKLKDTHLNLSIPNNVANILRENIESVLKEKLEEMIIIHIGKRSVGWHPLFQKTNYYNSVKGIEDFYNKNKESIIIINEYDEEFTFEELRKELIDWGKQESQKHYGRGYYEDEEGYDFSEFDFS